MGEPGTTTAAATHNTKTDVIPVGSFSSVWDTTISRNVNVPGRPNQIEVAPLRIAETRYSVELERYFARLARRTLVTCYKVMIYNPFLMALRSALFATCSFWVEVGL